MSGSYYTLDQKYNNLLALVNSLINSGAVGSDLNAVLAAGNDANGQSITDLNNVDLVTVNGSAYPPLVAGDNLTNVLTNGNDASALSMTNINDVGLTTINGAAYPATTYNVVENAASAVSYPVFTSAAGATQTLNVNAGITPISINAGTGDLLVDRTLKCEGSAAGGRVGVGFGAGSTTQGQNSVAVGSIAGQTSQGRDCCAVGNGAGNDSQSDQAIAIGVEAGATDQGVASIAIGAEAGNGRMGTNSVAIGTNAGNDRMGRSSIAIGNQAGVTIQDDNTIVLNATGVAINGDLGASRCLIAPIRGVALGIGIGVMFYDPVSFEVQYSTS